MTSKARSWWRRVTGRWTGPGAGDLPAVVAPAGPSIAQLGQEGGVPAHRFPAVFSAIATDSGEGHRGHEQAVAAGAAAGSPATGYPFMDIGILGVLGPPPSLRLPLDGAYPIGVAATVARTVLGVLLPVSAILALLGLSSSWRPPPSSSPEPALPPGGLFPADGAAVLGAETVLRTGDESPPAALQEARAPEGISRLRACLPAQDAIKTISMFFLASARSMREPRAESRLPFFIPWGCSRVGYRKPSAAVAGIPSRAFPLPRSLAFSDRPSSSRSPAEGVAGRGGVGRTTSRNPWRTFSKKRWIYFPPRPVRKFPPRP